MAHTAEFTTGMSLVFLCLDSLKSFNPVSFTWFQIMVHFFQIMVHELAPGKLVHVLMYETSWALGKMGCFAYKCKHVNEG